MNQFTLSLLAFIAGVLLAIQGGLNAHLGVLLKHPLYAAVVAFFSSTLLALLAILFTVRALPNFDLVKEIPYYLWFTGGLFSMLGIGLYYYTIPQLGVSTMISLGLCGQLIFAVIAGHFGWLNLPLEPITIKRATGVLAMVVGIFLINWK